MKKYVADLKQKPLHVRRNVALGVSGAVTGLVAIAWVGTLAATGTFALAPAGPGVESPIEVADTRTQFSELLGAAGGAFGATTSAPELVIVDGYTASTITAPSQNATDATVIPF